MGGGRWDTDKWNTYSTASFGSSDRATLRSKSLGSMYSAKTLHEDLDPKMAKLGMREARDSDDNPASTAVIIMSDVTGSMGHTAQEVLSAFDLVCTELYDRKPITDPAILTGAIGDMYCDRAPLQVTQFESDIRIADSTKNLYIEGNGGGNFGESYAGAWLFGGMMTSIDCFEKRGEKGFLFTVGDEPCLGAEGLRSGFSRGGEEFGVTRDQAKTFMGLDLESGLTAEQCYDLAAEKYEIFHICVNKRYEAGVEASFGKILGDRLIWLEDVKALPELIVSLIQMVRGASKKEVVDSWSGDTSLVIAKAVGELAIAGGDGGSDGGVARL